MKNKKIFISLIILTLIVLGVTAFGYAGFDNSNKISVKAIQENNPSLCSSVRVIPLKGIFDITGFIIGDSTHGARAECYIKVAKSNNNLTACNLVGSTYAGDCYTQLVIEEVKNEYSKAGCENIIQGEDKIACYSSIMPSVIGHFTNICDQAPNQDIKDVCYTSAAQRIADTSDTYYTAYIGICEYVKDIEYKKACRGNAGFQELQGASYIQGFDNDVGLKIYQSNTYGFEFKYPQDWKIRKSAINKDNPDIFNVIVEKGEYQWVLSVANKYASEIETFGKLLKSMEQIPIIIDGRNLHRDSVAEDNPHAAGNHLDICEMKPVETPSEYGYDAKCKQFTKHKDRAIQISYQVPSYAYNTNIVEMEMDSISKSFKIISN